MSSVKKNLRFNDNMEIKIIPYEDRKGIWMQYSIDRAHFKRRIDQAEIQLSPFLLQRVNNFKLSRIQIK